jgi:hypothetical protein
MPADSVTPPSVDGRHLQHRSGGGDHAGGDLRRNLPKKPPDPETATDDGLELAHRHAARGARGHVRSPRSGHSERRVGREQQPTTTRQPLRRRRVAWLTAGVGLLAVVAVVGVAVRHQREQQRPHRCSGLLSQTKAVGKVWSVESTLFPSDGENEDGCDGDVVGWTLRTGRSAWNPFESSRDEFEAGGGGSDIGGCGGAGGKTSSSTSQTSLSAARDKIAPDRLNSHSAMDVGLSRQDSRQTEAHLTVCESEEPILSLTATSYIEHYTERLERLALH